jgi:drug/metabolite transporter (DMT)-like permease
MLIVPIVAFRYKKSIVKVNKRELLILLALSIVQIFLPNFLQNIGLEYTTASVASVLQSTTPVFTLILAFTFLGERASERQIAGAIIAMLGVTLLSTGGNLNVIAGSQLLGNLLQVGVAASYGVSGIIGKVLLKRHPPLLVVAYSFVFGGVLLSVFSILFERSSWPSSVSVNVIVAMLLLSFLYCLGLVSWYTLLQRSGVFRLYALLFLMPVLAVIISILVLNENFTPLDVVFSGAILVGVGLTESGKNRRVIV